jgi:hypothetical protein
MLGQMLDRRAPLPGSPNGVAASPGAPMSSTGTTTSISSALLTPASTIRTGRGESPE